MLKNKKSLFIFILIFLSPLLNANDKGFLEYKKEEGEIPVVKQEINAELEMRLRRLEETNKRLTEKLADVLDAENIPYSNKLLDPEAEEEVNNEEVEKALTLQEKADIESFNYSDFKVVAEASEYFILRDSDNKRKIVKKSEIEEFNNKIIQNQEVSKKPETTKKELSTRFEGK